MIFGKHINRYYLRFAHLLIMGLAALVVVDYLQLIIPNLYQMVINGINTGFVDGVKFDVSFLVEHICMPMVASTGMATVREALPKPERSWMAATRRMGTSFMVAPLPSCGVD